MKLFSALALVLMCGAFLISSAQAQSATRGAAAAESAPLTAEAIMARVGANQDQSEQARKQYVYRQHIHVVTRKTNGKLMREETTDYHMVPQADKTHRQLEKLTKYVFRLAGRESFQGRDAYRVSFTPADKDDIDWAGEAYIDATDFEPIYVYTKLSRKIPFAVRTLLGTDLPGVGYSLHFEKQPGGVWFPKSYGTEFTLHVLFLFNREVMVSLDNKDFEQTHVETKITAEAPGSEQ